MAKGQQQGVGAITVWMIIFVALWLTSTVFLVILYTGQEDLRVENERLAEAQSRMINTSQERSIPMIGAAKAGGPTVVGIIEGARAETARLATGNEADDPAAVRAKRSEIVNAITQDRIVQNPKDYQDTSLFEALSALYEGFRTEHALRLESEKRLESLDAEVARLTQLNADLQNNFDQRAKEFTGEFAEIEAKHEAYRTERDQAVAELQALAEQRRERADAMLTSERNDRSQLERDLEALKERFAAQQQISGGLRPGAQELATARQPDGTVLTAIPGDEVVYIDLGKEDRLTLGLRFAVYSAEGGLPADGRGKGQIEVVAMRDTSAECRIVHVSPNSLIVEGDLVANPIYDPKRPLSFLAIGGFDLDRDGQVDPNGLATVEAMVVDWGGTITSELTSLTDFVILGTPPPKPTVVADESERTARDTARLHARERYDSALTSARNMAIPLMPQDVFLNFLGYSTRTASR